MLTDHDIVYNSLPVKGPSGGEHGYAVMIIFCVTPTLGNDVVKVLPIQCLTLVGMEPLSGGELLVFDGVLLGLLPGLLPGVLFGPPVLAIVPLP